MNNQSDSHGQPTLLIIVDGFGINDSKINNGVAAANTPNLDRYFAQFPHTELKAAGPSVGLPKGQMGNSEVGHLTLGAGAIMRQYLVSIDNAIDDGSFFDNKALLGAVEKAKKNQRPLHLLGLVSEGGVHSHNRHLLGLIELCRRHDVSPVLHAITDGRDTAPQAALSQVTSIEPALRAANGHVATVSGRFYAMDRDNRWDRTERAWQAMINQQGKTAQDLTSAIEQSYAVNEFDEFIQPTVIEGASVIAPNDQVVFFNFRKDRTQQLTAALSSSKLDLFDRGNDFQPINVTCMTQYNPDFDLPFAYCQERPATTLAETIADAGLSQFHCAETEKYAHVTYFFNGGKGDCHDNETHLVVPSPQVETYDQAPEMSAHEVADHVIEGMLVNRYEFIVVNFANGDMVGHTAIRDAVVTAVETLDKEVGRVLDAARQIGYSVLLTADHGNCEQLIDPETGKPHTQHTTNPVPCLIIDKAEWALETAGGLKDVAPTVLQLMGLNKPESMTGHSLLRKPEDASSSKEAAA